MISQEVGYDALKKIHGRKRHLTVDLLGLVLRVLVTSASLPERTGAKKLRVASSLYGRLPKGQWQSQSPESLTYDLDGWWVSRRRLYALGDGCVSLFLLRSSAPKPSGHARRTGNSKFAHSLVHALKTPRMNPGA
jgi:hypothetical protein